MDFVGIMWGLCWDYGVWGLGFLGIIVFVRIPTSVMTITLIINADMTFLLSFHAPCRYSKACYCSYSY